MSVSRRRFVHVLGAGSLGALLAPTASARGLEARHDAHEDAQVGDASARAVAQYPLVRLDSNENPNGPGRAALDAMAAALAGAHRYAFNATAALRDAIARAHGVQPANVAVGAGSTDVLRGAVHAWASPVRPLVTAAPSFETAAVEAARLGAPVRAVPVRGDLRLDLAAMGGAARDAGLVYLCNPNNPTATAHARDAVAGFVGRLRRESPGCAVLVDEAYHEYVDDPRYATAIPLALEDPRVIVARTFSKVHGLAGMRVGYAVGHADAIARLAPHMLEIGVNAAGAAAPPAPPPRPSAGHRRRRGRRTGPPRRGRARRAGARPQPRGARVHAALLRRRRVRPVGVGGQLRHGRPAPRREGVSRGVPRPRRGGRPPLPAAPHPRARHRRQHGRDAPRDRRVPLRAALGVTPPAVAGSNVSAGFSSYRH